MAIYTDEGISGAIGKYIFYVSNGKKCIRAKPGKRKKKRGQVANPLNTIFGLVSRYGTAMMSGISYNMLLPFRLSTYNLARGWMRNQYAAQGATSDWELAAKRNTMCQLNPEADLRDFLNPEIAVNDDGAGLISINIPALDPKADLNVPVQTEKVNLKMFVVTSPFLDNGFRHQSSMEQYSIDHVAGLIPAKKFVINANKQAVSAGDITLVVIALEFETRESGKLSYNTSLKYLPAAIIAMGILKK